MLNIRFSLIYLLLISSAIVQSYGELTPNHYDPICPQALPTIRRIVQEAITKEARLGASLLRLFFHDCWVNGCDGSVLLDDKLFFIGEKTAVSNINSLRGFDVIDQIKTATLSACKGNVVSCADIVAVAARDSVYLLGGPLCTVLLGRKDARSASLTDANNNLPAPSSSLSTLISNFQAHDLDIQDLVVLSGAHTIGLAHCTNYLTRIYTDTDIDPGYRALLQKDCPNILRLTNNTAPLDNVTSTTFDTNYYNNLLQRKGLLHSDQQLYQNGGSKIDDLVEYYSKNPMAFRSDFNASLVKMGNIKPLTGEDGEIRLDCKKVN